MAEVTQLETVTRELAKSYTFLFETFLVSMWKFLVRTRKSSLQMSL